ncbi:MAG TPA: ABC transporter permease [Bryobacteraceae bacterium]|jgi:predicted permease|nr:ABC transporter permease [Bryobacteraceae bacterium]
MLGEFIRRSLRLFASRKRVDREMEEEMRLHRELRAREIQAEGASADEARYAAQRRFGNTLRLSEEVHQAWGWTGIDELRQDLRYGIRMLHKSPLFTLVVVMTLGLGIGATTAVYSVVDRILFRALPYANADRIVSVGLIQSLETEEFTLGSFFFDWRDNQKPFAAFASQQAGAYACDLIGSNSVELFCIRMQAGFLPMLGIRPLLGRNFLPEEDRPHGPPVALISYGLWRNRFGGDPTILNRLIDLGGKSVRVVGVLPQRFETPTLQPADVFLPFQLDEEAQRNTFPGTPMRTFARLRPGLSIAQARSEMEPLFLSTEQKIPTSIRKDFRKDFRLSIRSLRDRETEGAQLASWILLGAVFAVMLIACANVASLMMTRGAAREHELAVRSALGASRARLIRQSLTEALLLSLAGAGAGMAVAVGLLRIFVALAPTGIPFLGKAHLDSRIVTFTILVSLACGVAFGLLPALEKPRAMMLAVRSIHSSTHAVVRRGLVVAQIAISMVLLSGAALLLRSFVGMESQPLGIQTRGVLSATIALPDLRFPTGQKKMQFYLDAEAAMLQLPGVSAVAWTDSLPPGGWHDGRRLSDFAVAGRPRTTATVGEVVVCRRVTPDFFRALNIPIIRGRNFDGADRNSRQNFALLNRLLAARLFPGSDPIGQRIQVDAATDGPWYTIVGIAENLKNDGLNKPDDPEIYFLRRNIPDDWTSGRAPLAIVDSVLPPQVVAPSVRSRIAELDPRVPIKIEPIKDYVSRLADRPRFETALLGFFAFAGVTLAAIGLYGVVAFMTAQRTTEIGVRMAIGATRIDILRLVLRDGLRLAALGGVVGLVAALVLTRALRDLLFQVGPHDPVSFVAVTLLLVLVALAATLIPARSAMGVEPATAVRGE